MRGKFIVIDGGEGSGKTSALRAAALHFKEKLVTTHEPGGTALAESVRAIILSPDGKRAPADTHFALNWAQRADHLAHLIVPTLAKGISVISDRFDSSTYAYQVGGQNGAHLEELFWQTRAVFLRDCTPDLYVFFDIAPQEALPRIAARKGKTHFDEQDMAFHTRVRENFKKFFAHVPHEVLDARGTQEAVAANFISLVERIIDTS